MLFVLEYGPLPEAAPCLMVCISFHVSVCFLHFFPHVQDMERERLRGEAGDAMEDVEEEDTVPEILPRHFEDAVRNARRSVSDRDLAQYSSFAQNLQQVRGVLVLV